MIKIIDGKEERKVKTFIKTSETTISSYFKEGFQVQNFKSAKWQPRETKILTFCCVGVKNAIGNRLDQADGTIRTVAVWKKILNVNYS
jgi:hypothetical protein